MRKQGLAKADKKAARVARQRTTISKLPKATRTALGKQANKVKRRRGK